MDSTSFETLPVGLILDIAEWLPFNDKCQLSFTNSALRNTMLPQIFRSIRVSCPLKEDRDIRKIVQDYKNYIRRLHVDVKMDPNEEHCRDSTTHHEPVPSVWGETTAAATIVKAMIQGKALPRCFNLSIRFNLDQSKEGEVCHAEGSEHEHFYPADWAIVNEWEETLAWRVKHDEVWRDITANTSIRRLDISNLLPRRSEVWQTQGWSVFLGKLQDLNVGLFGSNNGSGWNANSYDRFINFIMALPDSMLCHTTHLQRLGIAADSEGVIGSTCDNLLLPLPLRRDTLPHLRWLRLKNVVVGSELMDFLRALADGLRELHFENCMSNAGNMDVKRGPSWAELWRLVREVNTELIVVSFIQEDNPPLTSKDSTHQFAIGNLPAEETDEIREIRKKLQEDERNVLWRYVDVHSEYGIVLELIWQVIDRFQAGEDNMQYQGLLDEVARRRQRLLSNKHSPV
ncbi:hypothetical protein FZEAL_4946 [Fusarium zealandicum]|uniref:F-box domain-containing protein n=1 Tax=Fusarium zealandicum TaxID=1053134 RepID=A0A8H4UKR3_9HYPO|nr:hypothetical protein FZEAL_4946 [Fusarium zealandicum]